MTWPHTLRVYSQAAGSHDANDVFTPGAEAAVYDDKADVQDGPVGLERDEAGRPTLTADAVAFLKDETKLSDVEFEMYAVITWEDGTTSEAVVRGTRRLDGKVFLDYRKR